MNVTEPALPSFAAISVAMLMENAAPAAMAHDAPAKCTVNTLPPLSVAPVAVQEVPEVMMVTLGDALVANTTVLEVSVTVILLKAAKAPVLLVVAPNVINPGVAEVL